MWLNAPTTTNPQTTTMDLPINCDNLRRICLEMQTALPESRLTDGVLAGLEAYLSLVSKWNKVMNLVGPNHWADILQTLVADSFYLTAFLESLPLPPEPECWDLGAGAGLPGIPLRVLWPKGRYTMVEAREKRALFLQTALSGIATSGHALPGVSVFRGRAETFMPKRPPADLVVSRAFLPWEKVLELIEPFTAPEGFAVFLTLTPLPKDLPRAWTAGAQTQYDIAGDARYLWALRLRR